MRNEGKKLKKPIPYFVIVLNNIIEIIIMDGGIYRRQLTAFLENFPFGDSCDKFRVFIEKKTSNLCLINLL